MSTSGRGAEPRERLRYLPSHGPEEVAAPGRAHLDRRTWLLDSALLAAVAVLIRLPAFLSPGP